MLGSNSELGIHSLCPQRAEIFGIKNDTIGPKWSHLC